MLRRKKDGDVSRGDFLIVALVFSFILLISTAAPAQEVSVGDTVDIGDVVITGTKTEKRIEEAPVVTKVITEKEISDKGAVSLYEILEGEPSIRVEQQCSNCNFTILRMLGMGSGNSIILIDGQPIFSGLASVYGLQQIQAGSIERIEIVKGAGSALYGSDAIAGVVNVILKEPSAKPKTKISMQIGTEKTNSFTFSTSGREDRVAYVVSGQKNVSGAIDDSGGDFASTGGTFSDTGPDNFTDRVESDNQGVSAKMYYYDIFGPSERLSLNLNHISESRRGGNFDTWDDQFHPDNEHISTKRYELGIGYKKMFSNNSTLKFNVTRVNHHRNATNGAAWDNVMSAGVVDGDTNLTAEAVAHYDASNGGIDLAAYYAAEGYNPGDEEYEAGQLSDLDGDGYLSLEEIRPQPFIVDEEMTLFDINYNFKTGEDHDWVVGYNRKSEDTSENINRTYNKKTIDEWALYIQDDIQLSQRLEAVVGGRFDSHDSDDTKSGGSYSESVFNPRMALRYKLDEADTLRFSLGKGYSVPASFAEDLHLCASAPKIAKPADLSPEEAVSLTLGWDRRIKGTKFNFDVFFVNTKDKITLDVDNPPVGYDAKWANGGDASTKGFELGISHIIERVHEVRLGYVYTNAEFDDPLDPSDPDSINIMRAPRHTATMGYTYNNDDTGWRFVLDGRYYGKMYIEHADEGETGPPLPRIEQTDAYSIWDTRVSKSLHNGATYFVGVENLFDYIQERRDNADAAYMWAPIYGSVYYIGAEYEF
ncbi:MAG TPA: TonB-dependent receptor [bacterium]|nr:TonB-dependent receptor [bacterium]